MKFVKLVIAGLTACIVTTAAHAQDNGIYAALGATTYDFDHYGADIKLGYNFNKNFGIEAQGTLGLTTKSTLLYPSPDSATYKAKVDHTLGVFAVARLPLSEQFEVFARGGIHTTKYSADINNILRSNFDAEETGFAAGAGVQYNLNSKNAIRAEYTNLGDFNFDTATIAYVRKF